jgi:electron transfer flavoprotein alpha subunit
MAKKSANSGSDRSHVGTRPAVLDSRGEVWVFAEQENGQLHDVSVELLSKGRELADTLGVRLASVLLGQDVKHLSRRLIAHGADRVYVGQHPGFGHYQTQPYARALVDLVREKDPQVFILGATEIGRDLAPRVASALKAGLTADCTDLQIGDHLDLGTQVEHKNLLYQIRPAFGGNIIATIVNFARWPQMATVREGVMRLGDPDPNRKGEVIEVPVAVDPADQVLTLLERVQAERTINLKASRVIVAGGAGVGSKDGFKVVYELAHVLGAAVGASRAAVDLGYIDKPHQVGQTGTTVRPALYIACGISGAVQHRAGMSESAKIVAINKDPEAPIFGIAHYGIVGDLHDVVPKMVKAIRKRS